MKVMILSPYPDRLAKIIKERDEIVLPENMDQADFLVSFGHRKIIPATTLERFKDRAINIHIGMLPWNKGADPNFWSWFDDTAKGVTIHQLSNEIDAGKILYQLEIEKFWQSHNLTLKTSYNELMETAARVFSWTWPTIRQGTCNAVEQAPGGSYHKLGDKDPWMKHLPWGWDTQVAAVQALGRHQREPSSLISSS